MNIELILPEDARSYVQYVRRETLEAIGEEVHPELLEPAPFGMYLVAYGGLERTPMGLAEFAFYDQLYSSFEETPYPMSLGLSDFGSLDAFVGTRTIFVEPEARSQVPPYYLMLSMAGCYLAHQYGATHTTASTNANDAYLMKLYKKTGGTLAGTYIDKTQAKSEVAVFVFTLADLIARPAMKRLQGKFHFDPLIVETLRSRN